MTLKRYSCRTHGGIFTKESKAGRPPVRCTPEYLCDKADQPQGTASNRGAIVAGVGKPAATSSMRSVIPDFHSMTNAELKAYARENFSTIGKVTSRNQLIAAMEKQMAAKIVATREGVPVEQVTAVTVPESPNKLRGLPNDSLPLAKRAKEQLEAVGWSVSGRAGSRPMEVGDAPDEQWAEVIASRGAETLIMTWVDGVLTAQDYSFEHLKPSENGIPGRKLNFDPEELTDRELVQKISGMKVTWWNTLASSTESAIVPGDKVRIEHIFRGGGDEDNSKRIVTFVDRNAGGFRSFYVSALMKVG